MPAVIARGLALLAQAAQDPYEPPPDLPYTATVQDQGARFNQP